MSSSARGLRKYALWASGILETRISLKLVVAVVLILLLPQIVPYIHSRFAQAPPPQARPPEGLGITDLIRKVKQELAAADEQARQNREAALFQMKDFDLELSFMVQARSVTHGKVNYELVAVDSETQTGSERVQKIRLHMTTVTPEHHVEAARAPSPDSRPRVIGPVPPPAPEVQR